MADVLEKLYEKDRKKRSQKKSLRLSRLEKRSCLVSIRAQSCIFVLNPQSEVLGKKPVRLSVGLFVHLSGDFIRNRFAEIFHIFA